MRAGEQVMAVPCACTSVRATCATFFRKPVHSLAFSPTATSMKYCPRCASGSRLRDGSVAVRMSVTSWVRARMEGARALASSLEYVTRNAFVWLPAMPVPAVPAPSKLVIATRESALALWQAKHVAECLRARYPSCTVELLGLTTQGDRILDKPLAAIGGKGLFIKELEE